MLRADEEMSPPVPEVLAAWAAMRHQARAVLHLEVLMRETTKPADTELFVGFEAAAARAGAVARR